MAQRQQWRSSGNEQAWLALLVESFETISREPLKVANAASMSGLKLQLAHPAAALMSSAISLH